MYRWLVVAFGLLFMQTAAYAQLYKCVSASGRVTYQEVPCGSGASESTIQVRGEPSQEDVEEARRINQSIQSAAELFRRPLDSSADVTAAPNPADPCPALVMQYEAEKRQIIASCQARHEDYCDNVPSAIVEIQDSRWLDGASEQQWRNYTRNHEQPLIKILESKMTGYKCQYEK